MPARLPRTRLRRRAASATAALVAILLAGCTAAPSGGTSTGSRSAGAGAAPASTPAPSNQGPQDLQPTGIVGLNCSGQYAGNNLMLYSISPEASDRVTGMREIQLPENASFAYGCDSSAPLLRSMFDKDYSHLAVTIRLEDGSQPVGVMDTKTGEIKDLEQTADDGSFSSTLQDHSPVFGAGGDLWFQSDISGNRRQVKTMPVTGGGATAVGLPVHWYDRNFTLTGATQRGIEVGPLSNPAGTAAALFDKSFPRVLSIYAEESIAGDAPSKVTPLGTINGTRIGLPLTWIDNCTVIVSVDIGTIQYPTATSFEAIRLHADFRGVEAEHPLLEDTNRNNRAPVGSPDGTRVAFISTAGQVSEVFVTAVSTTGRTEPSRILPAAPGTLIAGGEPGDPRGRRQPPRRRRRVA